jgi:hypothetical protein
MKHSIEELFGKATRFEMSDDIIIERINDYRIEKQILQTIPVWVIRQKRELIAWDKVRGIWSYEPMMPDKKFSENTHFESLIDAIGVADLIIGPKQPEEPKEVKEGEPNVVGG